MEASPTGADGRTAHRPQRRARGAGTGAWLLWALLSGASAQAEPDAAVEAESTATSDAGVALPDDPEVERLNVVTAQIGALRDGSLELGVDPASLFDVALTDEAAVAVEAERLRRLLAKRPVSPEPPVAQTRRGRRAGSAQAAEPTPPDAPEALAPRVDARRWAARMALDRARLDFYALPADERGRLLAAHAARVEKHEVAALQEVHSAVSEAEQRARAAELERQQALEAAARAQSEAERAVADEHARLLGVAQRHSALETELARAKAALAERTEVTLRFRREVRELVSGKPPDAAAADALYTSLRTHLRGVRSALGARLSASPTQAERPGRGPELPETIDHTEVDRLRAKLAKAADALQAAFGELRDTELDQLEQDMVALNADRLALLELLSRETRDAIIGFGVVGLDQAAAEILQVTLLTRYHLHVLVNWTAALRSGATGRDLSAVGTAFVALKVAITCMIFLYWRRHSALFIVGLEARARTRRDPHAVDAAPIERALAFLARVHRPLEALALVFVLVALLPASARELFEVALAKTVLTWTLGGALVVLSLDALAGDPRGRLPSQPDLRLRSLKLLGHTVVGFGLTLALSDRLVGKGTIHSWVFSTCWFAALPIALVLVRWWRKTIFQRVERVRRKSEFHVWVIANQRGWKSLIAAISAGLVLFVQGGVRGFRTWVSRFDLTRKVLAYLFRRGLDKLGDDASLPTLQPLDRKRFASLAPARPSPTLISDRASDEVQGIIERINRVGGGVFAVVGERGSGKTTALRRVSEGVDAVRIQCPVGGLDALRREIAEKVGLAEDASWDEATAVIDAPERDAALLIDDAHRLIQPVMGGLASFDALMEVARRRSNTCTWVLALDQSIWHFFERARGSRPLFDEVISLTPWHEEEITRLLAARSRDAGVDACFEDLLGTLPVDADEVDREEALAATAAGYYRLLWDYAAGNPGVALHMWRRSLGTGADGRAHVKVFRAPDTADLEQLPDSAVFVLRAVVQLEPAALGDIARATQLAVPMVQDALRYGLARGYFAEEDGRYELSWGWYRAITRFLQRRHLLATGT